MADNEPGPAPQAERPDTGWSRRGLFFLLLVFAVALAAASFALESSRPDYKPELWLDLSPEPPGHTQPTPAPELRLRVAVAPVMSPEHSLVLYRSLVEHLAKRLGRTPEFLWRSSYAEVNDLVRLGRCDLAIVCTHAYIVGRREFGMKVLAVPQIEGVTTYQSYFIVRREDPSTSLLDLRGKRFASADVMSTSGWLYPVTWLQQRGEDPKTFFASHIISRSHDRSVRAVVAGTVDGAAVDSIVYNRMVKDDPQVGLKTRIIHRSPPFGAPPLVVPADIDPELELALSKLLRSLHREPKGRALLEALGFDRFVAPIPGLYKSVESMAQAWKEAR